jgi:hypothetical protein
MREVKVEIPVGDLKLVADNDTSVKIASPVGEVTLDTGALDGLIAGVEERNASTAEIGIAKAEPANLTDAQRATLNSDARFRAVFDVSVRAGGEVIGAFQTPGGTLTIGLPYALGAGEAPGGVKVEHIKEEGGSDRMPGSRYNEAGQLAVFQTDHLSVFAVVYEKEAGSDEEKETGSGGGGCDAGLGAAGMMVLLLGMANSLKARGRKTR